MMHSVAALPSTHRQGVTAIRRIALIGNPNTGKTTLFNALCGARAKNRTEPMGRAVAAD
jgi:tRNA U34 5-carboxymethylaminomethyl modifying GTPase MnmE/TrmE